MLTPQMVVQVQVQMVLLQILAPWQLVFQQSWPYDQRSIILTFVQSPPISAFVHSLCAACPAISGEHIHANSSGMTGSMVNVSCDDGYTMNGNPLLVCLSSGQWSPAVPSCVGGTPAPSSSGSG